jgi:hypothetical protein
MRKVRVRITVVLTITLGAWFITKSTNNLDVTIGDIAFVSIQIGKEGAPKTKTEPDKDDVPIVNDNQQGIVANQGLNEPKKTPKRNPKRQPRRNHCYEIQSSSYNPSCTCKNENRNNSNQ